MENNGDKHQIALCPECKISERKLLKGVKHSGAFDLFLVLFSSERAEIDYEEQRILKEMGMYELLCPLGCTTEKEQEGYDQMVREILSTKVEREISALKVIARNGLIFHCNNFDISGWITYGFKNWVLEAVSP